MAWTSPEDDEVWTSPEGDVPTNEIVNDPRAAGIDVPAEIPAEVVPQSWLEAMFPRTSQAMEGDAPWYSPQVGLSSILDQASLPGRAVMALGRPQGEGFQEALARTEAPETIQNPGFTVGNRFRVGGEASQRMVENMARDPATIPLSMTGGMAPAWLARLGWLGRGAVTGAGAGATVAATNQAENVAAGRDVSARQALLDASIGTGFGIGGGLLGATGGAMQRFAVPAGMKLAKVPKAFREGVAEAFPEMLKRGVMRPTVKGIQKAAGKQEAQIGTLYAAGKAGTEGVPAVPLGMYSDRAANLLQGEADNANIRRAIADDASDWIREWGAGAKPAPGAASPGMVDVPTAINARSRARIEAGSYESQAPKSAVREARQDAANEFASGINSRLDVVAPGVREADKFAAPYFQFRPYLDALGVRGNNYEIGLTELGAGGLGGALGSAAGPGGTTAGIIGAALLARLQRSPALPYGLYRGGSLGQALAAPAIRTVPLASSATDNARGGR